MSPDRFRDFCLNEEARLRRFARELEEHRYEKAAKDLRDVADELLLLANEGLYRRMA